MSGLHERCAQGVQRTQTDTSPIRCAGVNLSHNEQFIASSLRAGWSTCHKEAVRHGLPCVRTGRPCARRALGSSSSSSSPRPCWHIGGLCLCVALCALSGWCVLLCLSCLDANSQNQGRSIFTRYSHNRVCLRIFAWSASRSVCPEDKPITCKLV